MARGGGRSNGKSGRGNSKSNRGFHSSGRSLHVDSRGNESSSSGMQPGGRGGRRGGNGRGGSLSVRSQNAVAFDYQSIQPRHAYRKVAVDNSGPSKYIDKGFEDSESSDDSDIIIEPPKSYRHKSLPHLEEDSASSPNTTNVNDIIASSLVTNGHRMSSTLEDLQRVERIRRGQVASIIPTGPKSAHIHRLYGTQDEVRKHNDVERQSRASGIESVRPNRENKQQADPYLGGIPRHLKARPGKADKERSYFSDPSLHTPVAFIKATGDWRDGQLIQEHDQAKENSTLSESPKRDTNPLQHHKVGAGLGYRSTGIIAESSNLDGTKDVTPMNFDVIEELSKLGSKENDDLLCSLMQAYPGSTELAEGTAMNEAVGFYQAPPGVFNAEQSNSPRAKSSELLEAHSSDGEDVILISRSDSGMLKNMDHGRNLAQSDSEEERQLDDIIRHHSQKETCVPEKILSPSSDNDGFYVDLTGGHSNNDDESQVDIKYELSARRAIGEASAMETTHLNSTSGPWESEDTMRVEDISASDSGRKSRNAVKKARRREKRRSQLNHEMIAPRQDDSDLEWGSDGPPSVQFRDPEAEKMFSLDQLKLNEQFTDVNTDPNDPPISMPDMHTKRQPQAKRPNFATSNDAKDLIIQDYLENLAPETDSEHEIVDQKDSTEDLGNKALLRFIQGMDGQRGGEQMTIEDITIQNEMDEEAEWMTDSDDESGDEGKSAQVDQEFNKIEDRIIEGLSLSSPDNDGVSPSGGSGDDDDEISYSEDESDEAEEDESDEEERDAFEDEFTWADADEDFIDRIDQFARSNHGLLKGRNRAVRNRLFKAIETGDFADLDGGLSGGIEDLDLANDPIFSAQPAPRGKQAQKKKWKDDDLWANELQSQWQKDRAKKADNKRKRAEQRALDADSPFPNTNGKKGTKKAAKKAARAEARAARKMTMDVALNGARDGDYDTLDFGADASLLSRHATSLPLLDKQIHAFLRDNRKTTLSLPPMDKHIRAQVHMLANCYNLTSKSKGSGSKRFPTLIKNSRSGRNIQQRRIDSILRSSTGGFGSGSKPQSEKADRRIRSTPVPRNQEGASVGFGADRISEENIGHRLLMAMGWKEGSGVGATQGIADPVGATIKISRGGLGF